MFINNSQLTNMSSCICQYFVHSKDETPKKISNSIKERKEAIKEEFQIKASNDKSICYSSKIDVSASDLVAARAETWILRKSLAEACISIENLESLVKTIIDRQNVMLSEMYHLKRMNYKLQDECRLQRDYHTMERNAMIRELHDIKTLLNQRSKALEKCVAKNCDLFHYIEDANEKMYLMGMKYLKITDNDHSEESAEEVQSDQTEHSDESEAEAEA